MNIMKRFFGLLTGIIFMLNCYSQDSLFVLHPLVGDTIDKNEKTNYMLFQEISDSVFKYGYITHSKDGYFINYCILDNSMSISKLDTSLIIQYRTNLDKLSEYYSNQAQKDSIKNAKKMVLDLNPLYSTFKNDKIIAPETRDKIENELRQNNRLNGDAERAKYVKQGTEYFGNGARIEFLRKKK